MGISACSCSRDSVSSLIHVFDVELYAKNWDIWLAVTKLNAVIEALFSSFLKAVTSAVRDL